MAFGTPISQFDLQNAQALKEQLGNFQNQVAWGENRQAAPGTLDFLAALSQMSQQGQNAPQPPMPGQPSTPSQPPMGGPPPSGGPNISSMPPSGGGAPPVPVNSPITPNTLAQLNQMGGAPPPMSTGQVAPMVQSQNNPVGSPPAQGGGPNISQMMQQPPQENSQFGQSGYSLQQMMSALNSAMPTASPQVKLLALTQAQGVLNNDAKQQLAMFKAAYMPQQMAARVENADTARGRTDAYIANSQREYNEAFNPTGTPPPPPPQQLPMPGQQANPASQTPPSPTTGSYASSQSDIAGAKSAGVKQENLEQAEAQFNSIAPLAIEKSNLLPRGAVQEFGKLNNWLYDQTNNTDFAAFQGFNRELINRYAAAFPGTASNQARADAEHTLEKARDPAAYAAAIKAVQKGMKKAVEGGKSQMQQKFNPQGAQPNSPPGNAPAADGDDFSHLW